jgi:hypothetical protein
MKKLLLTILFCLMAHGAFAYDYTQDANCVAAYLFTEGSGTTVADSSIVGTNTGNFVSSGHPAWSADTGHHVDYSASFARASGDNINIGDISGVDFGSGNFSYCCWIYPTTIDNTTRIIILGKDDAVNGRQLTLEVNGMGMAATRGSIRATIFGGGKVTAYDSPADTLSVNNWYHIVVVRNGNSAGNFYLWVNNVSTTFTYKESEDFPRTMDSTAALLQIGARTYSGNTDNFNGKITEIGIFSRALSSTEITDIYNNGLKGSAPASGGQMTTNKNFWGN